MTVAAAPEHTAGRERQTAPPSLVRPEPVAPSHWQGEFLDGRGAWARPTTSAEPLPLSAMTTYSGPARLILADGAYVTGMASLGTNQRGGLDSWGGTFRPDQTSADLGNEGDGLQLELPYDQIGTVAVTGVRKLLATQVLISLTGRGPAPF